MKFTYDNFLVSASLAFCLLISNTSILAADGALPESTNLALSEAFKSQSMWSNVGDAIEIVRQIEENTSVSSIVGRPVEINESDFKSLLTENTIANTDMIAARLLEPNQGEDKTIVLPLPDGTEVAVKIFKSSVMSEALSQQFPDIKTWKVEGVSQKLSGVIDFTHNGFHGMLIMPNGERVFIQPDSQNTSIDTGASSSKKSYLSFSAKQNQDNFNSEFSCGVKSDSPLNFSSIPDNDSLSARLLARAAPDLITYRLAVAATGEFTQYYGGTKDGALSAIVTIISRVNEIYTRDLGIKFELVDQQSDIIYLDANTDPYTNFDTSLLISENAQNLSSDGVLSESEYDVGHVFGTGSFSGLAYVASVCDDVNKAKGATRMPNPIGDAFAIDFVAHELGHQVGGSHTFNSSCTVSGGERIALSAVEPGSGSTIMAYAGICPPNDLQDYADAQFHIASINQIRTLTRSGTGSTCAVSDPNQEANENPTVSAGSDKAVPARTPLILKAEGADADNDELIYTWEQTDTGTASDVNVDEGDNALFRSQTLTTKNIRFIPPLNNLFSGLPSDGEYLPVSSRGIEMVSTVRDGKGGLISDLMNLEVVDTGDSFRITSNTNDQSFGRGVAVDLKWNVANTHLAPILCSSVDFGVVNRDGDITVFGSTANDGAHTFSIPDNAIPMADTRFFVSCTDGAFFNVSAGHITILDQVGGGSIGTSRTISSDTFLAIAGENIGSEKSGGGVFDLFTLFFISVLVSFRKAFILLKKGKYMKGFIKYAAMGFFFFTVQACSSPVPDQSDSSSDNITPEEFGDRFSIDNIKKEREAYYAKKRLELKNTSPSAEVVKALRSGNVYLMEVPAGRGGSRSLPGLVEPKILQVNCKTVPVEGMGDVLYGKNHILYRKELLIFMREFNALMIPNCK